MLKYSLSLLASILIVSTDILAGTAGPVSTVDTPAAVSKFPYAIRWIGRLEGSWAYPTNDDQFLDLVLVEKFDPSGFIDGHSVYKQNNINNTGSAGIGFGADILLVPAWRELTWQPSVAYYQTNTFKSEGVLEQSLGFTVQMYDYKYSTRSAQVMFDNKFLMTSFYGRVHPYGAVGFGAAFNRAEDFELTPWDPTSGPSPLFTNKSTTSFSYSLGLGVDFDVAARMRVGVGYRYVSYGLMAFGPSTEQNTDARFRTDPFATDQIIVALTFFM